MSKLSKIKELAEEIANIEYLTYSDSTVNDQLQLLQTEFNTLLNAELEKGSGKFSDFGKKSAAYNSYTTEIKSFPSYQELMSTLSVSKNEKKLESFIFELGIDNWCHYNSQKQEALKKDFCKRESEVHKNAELFIKVVNHAKTKEFSPFLIPDDLRHKLNDAKKSFQYKWHEKWDELADWNEIEISQSERNSFIRSLLKTLKIDDDSIDIVKANVPFWGSSYDTKLGSKNRLVIGSVNGLKSIPVLSHEIGHALDNQSHNLDLISYLTRPSHKLETFAYNVQHLYEVKDKFSLDLYQHIPALTQSIYNLNKRKEILYMLILIELDEVLWGQSKHVKLEDVLDTFHKACVDYLGTPPISPFLFMKELFHIVYPGYIINYFYAELSSFQLREKSSDLNSLLMSQQSLYSPSFDETLNIETIAKQRVQFLS